jgi:hypothetical protein
MKRICFKVTASDYLAVQEHIHRLINEEMREQQKKGCYFKIKSVFVGITVSLISVVPMMLFIVNNPASLNLYVAYLFMILFLLLFLSKANYRKKLLKLMNTRLADDESSYVVIGEHGVEDYSEGIHIVYKWHAIKTIDKWQDHILFLTPLYKGIFLPLRAFSSQEEMQAFLDEAKRLASLAVSKEEDGKAANHSK